MHCSRYSKHKQQYCSRLTKTISAVRNPGEIPLFLSRMFYVKKFIVVMLLLLSLLFRPNKCLSSIVNSLLNCYGMNANYIVYNYITRSYTGTLWQGDLVCNMYEQSHEERSKHVKAKCASFIQNVPNSNIYFTIHKWWNEDLCLFLCSIPLHSLSFLFRIPISNNLAAFIISYKI